MGRNADLILISVTTSTNRFNFQIISSTVKRNVASQRVCLTVITLYIALAEASIWQFFNLYLQFGYQAFLGEKREERSKKTPLPNPLRRPDTLATYTSGYSHLNVQVVILAKQ